MARMSIDGMRVVVVGSGRLDACSNTKHGISVCTWPPAPDPSNVPTSMSAPSLNGAHATHVGCEGLDIELAKFSARVTSWK